MQITVTLRTQDFNSKQVKVPAHQETKLQWARQTQLHNCVRQTQIYNCIRQPQLTEDSVKKPQNGVGVVERPATDTHYLVSTAARQITTNCDWPQEHLLLHASQGSGIKAWVSCVLLSSRSYKTLSKGPQKLTFFSRLTVFFQAPRKNWFLCGYGMV